MKKTIRFIMLLVIAVVLCSCSPKGGSDAGQEKTEAQDGKGGQAGDAPSGEKSWRQTKLQPPEGAFHSISAKYLADGRLRIGSFDEEYQNYFVWDSRDNGGGWEDTGTGADLTPEDGYTYAYSAEGTRFFFSTSELVFPANDGAEEKRIRTQEGESFFGAAASANTLAVLVNNDESWKVRAEIYDLQTMECRQIDNPQLAEYLTACYEGAGGNIALDSKGTVLYIEGMGIARYDLVKDEFCYLMDQDAYDELMGLNGENGLVVDIGVPVSFAVNDAEDTLIFSTWSMVTQQPNLYLCEWGVWKDEEPAAGDTLRIYSLKPGIGMAQEAAIFFQNMHPELKVTYESGYTGEDGVTLSDAIRTLNTELMAGEGPDILVLDGLPADSYAEKGILEELTDIVEPEKEKYYYNIISAYNGGGKIFQIPFVFEAPVLVGDTEVTAAQNREELMDVMKKKAATGVPFLPSECLSAAVGNLFITSDILGETLDEAKLADFYRDMTVIADLTLGDGEWETLDYSDKMVYWAENYPYLSFTADLDIYFDKAQAGIQKLGDMETTYAQLLTLHKEKGASFQYLNQENGKFFIAENVLGINKNGKNPDAAEEFLRYYLSGEVQSRPVVAGFPIIRGILEGSKAFSENGEYAGGISGKYTPDEVMPLYKVTPAELEELNTFFEGLDTPVKCDAVVLQKVMEQADACMFEGKEPESAAADACSEVNLYLSE